MDQRSFVIIRIIESVYSTDPVQYKPYFFYAAVSDSCSAVYACYLQGIIKAAAVQHCFKQKMKQTGVDRDDNREKDVIIPSMSAFSHKGSICLKLYIWLVQTDKLGITLCFNQFFGSADRLIRKTGFFKIALYFMHTKTYPQICGIVFDLMAYSICIASGGLHVPVKIVEIRLIIHTVAYGIQLMIIPIRIKDCIVLVSVVV